MVAFHLSYNSSFIRFILMVLKNISLSSQCDKPFSILFKVVEVIPPVLQIMCLVISFRMHRQIILFVYLVLFLFFLVVIVLAF